MRKATLLGAAILIGALGSWTVFGWVSGDASPGGDDQAEADAEDAAELRRQRELHIQECMAEEGFDYVPQLSEESEDADALPGSNGESLRDEGYGLATALVAGSSGSSGGAGSDANEDYYLSLGDHERDAYDAAMHGPEAHQGDQYEEGAFGDADDPGCQAEAYERYGDIGPEPAEGDPAELVRDLADRLAQDDELRRIDAEWSDCMADSGHAVDSLAEPPQLVQERLMDAERADGAVTEAPEEDPGSAMADAPDPADAYDPELLEEVRRFELELAAADADCRDDVEYERRYRERLQALARDG